MKPSTPSYIHPRLLQLANKNYLPSVRSTNDFVDGSDWTRTFYGSMLLTLGNLTEMAKQSESCLGLTPKEKVHYERLLYHLRQALKNCKAINRPCAVESDFNNLSPFI